MNVQRTIIQIDDLVPGRGCIFPVGCMPTQVVLCHFKARSREKILGDHRTAVNWVLWEKMSNQFMTWPSRHDILNSFLLLECK